MPFLVQLLILVISTALSIALAPKPKPPRSAAIDDFDFPTAEEGRPIPVVFGEVDLSGPNVVWFGDLQVNPIRRRSGFSRVTVGYKYALGFQIGLCHGPVDSITRIAWDGKTAWTGSITSNASASVSAPDLFGGEERGGGVVGEFDVAMGDAGQTANAYLQSVLGSGIPAFRGATCLIWKGPTGSSGRGVIGNSEQVRPLAIRVKRILSGWEGGAAWNPSKADLGNGLMNPAHIIYQVLTDSRWGMGIPTGRINATVFSTAADQLAAENFGLALVWNQSSTIEQFLQIVLEHVNGALVLRADSGQYELTLFRGGYNPATLPLFTAANVLTLDKFEKQAWGDTVNEVNLSYTDPATREPTSITAQDLGNIDAQGTRIPAVIELKGIRDHDVARSVLGRELANRATPLTRVSLEVNRTAWNLNFGDLFRLTWPERQCEERVFRALNIRKGTLQDNAISIDALEDIYQYPNGVGLETQPAATPPVAPPTPPTDDSNSASVISATLTTPPGSPVTGDRYYVPAGATGAWAGQSGKLAEWDGTAWVFTTLSNGTIFFIQDESPPRTVQIVGGVLVDFGGGMADPGSNGIVVRTALNVTIARSIAGTAGRIGVTNGSGVSGNPAIDMVALSPSPVGTFTNANVTVDAYGRVTAAANGGAGSGTVTSVGLSAPGIFSVSGSPVTSSGTLALSLTTQTANTLFAGPSSGGAAAPTFRALATADIPDQAITYAKIQDVAANSVLARANAANGPVSGVTLSASQLLGRGSSGDIAAIALGSGLTMTGTTLSAGTGTGQTAIQFQDEGSNLGSSGTVDTFDVVGGGATLTRVGNKITLTVPSVAAAFLGFQTPVDVYLETQAIKFVTIATL